MLASTLRLLFGLLIASLLAIEPAQAVDPAAKTFVDQIYAQYRGPNSPGVKLGREADLRRYFEPGLVALIVKDRKQAEKKGEVPNLDGDPFVNAQDWEITDVAVALADTGRDRAQATVSFRNFKQPSSVKLDLIKTAVGWRVYDVLWPEGTLRKLLSSP